MSSVFGFYDEQHVNLIEFHDKGTTSAASNWQDMPQFKMDMSAAPISSQTEMSINEIAWELGYEHATNFCVEFKKIPGVRPGLFRKSCF